MLTVFAYEDVDNDKVKQTEKGRRVACDLSESP